MKTIFSITLIAVLALLVHLYLPYWWLISIVAFLISFAFGENTWKAFLTGFFGIFFLWVTLTTMSSIHNDFILVERMSNILPFKNAIFTMLATAIIGGLVGGFSSLSGYYLKTMND
jgi:hypothetical protein